MPIFHASPIPAIKELTETIKENNVSQERLSKTMLVLTVAQVFFALAQVFLAIVTLVK